VEVAIVQLYESVPGSLELYTGRRQEHRSIIKAFMGLAYAVFNDAIKTERGDAEIPSFLTRVETCLCPFLDLKTWDAKSLRVVGGVKYTLAFSL
jgi:hypothetical protein